MRPPVRDLSGIILAVTTSRLGRRVLEVLAERPEQGSALIPPTVVPISALHQHLELPTKRRATATEETLAWLAAMDKVGEEVCSKVAYAAPSDRLMARLPIAEQLSTTHRVLRLAGLDMRQGLAEIARVAPPASLRRWEAMVVVEQAFLEQLDAAGLSDPAHIGAYTPSRSADHGGTRIVVADVPEVPEALCRALLSAPFPVDILVGAEEKDRDGFDRFGRALTDAWLDRIVPIPDEAIMMAQSLPDQAGAAVAYLETLCDRFGQDDISVALGDPSMEGVVREVLGAAGLHTHSAFPRSLARSRPASLLAAMCDYLDQGNAHTLASLVRHADVDAACAAAASRSPAWALHSLDKYRAERLPSRLSSLAPPNVPELDALMRAVDRLTRPLTGKRRPLPEWAEPMAAVLTASYTDVVSNVPDRSATLLATLDAFGDLLREAAGATERLAACARMTGTEAVRFVLRRAAGKPELDPISEPAAELLNWFELAHDDAPIKVVIGMNDGYIPESSPDDPWLPDAVRCLLGLPNSRSRHARDVFYLSRLVAATPHLALVVGEQTPAGDRLRPSRLLFACDDDRLAHRALRLFGHGFTPTRSTTPFAFAAGSAFAIPRPRPVSQPLGHLSVTAFADYLRCPYRFYLRHILGLASDEDELREMDALVFGSLLHEALGRFGAGPHAGDTHEQTVAAALIEDLHHIAEMRFGPEPPVGVKLQLGHAEARLRAFASWQAKRAADGWRICPDRVEVDAEGEVVVDGEPIVVCGRIDRIEVHSATGEYAILDYKTGDTAMSPQKVHGPSPGAELGWSNLQLPLYRRIAPVPKGARTRLGFLCLSQDLACDPLQEAAWSDADLETADRCADEVVRRIRQGKFWPPNPDVAPTGDGIGAICLDACAERLSLMKNPEPPWDTEG